MSIKQKALIIGVFAVQALPIPVSLITILGSLISTANIGMASGSLLVTIISIIAMVLAGTYSLTYVFSLINVYSKKKLSFISFLPIIHLVLAMVFVALWRIAER